MNPVLLQKQLKDNANDLSEIYKDLKTWGEEMKRKEKEETAQKANKKKEGVSKRRKKLPDVDGGGDNKNLPPASRTIAGTDYKAWDKFDADAECEKVDYNENEEDSLTDECDETAKDQALIEKDKGNKFVKEQKWQEAIKCYTKAIDCYSYDPIFYANRALCYLRTNSPTHAENDCNLSLKLDSTYVKAYQRRAAAREALGRLEEAEVDLEKVLEFEPKNQESRRALDGLRKKLEEKKKVPREEPPQRPVSKFTASRMNRNISAAHTGSLKAVSQTTNSQLLDNSIPSVSSSLGWAQDDDIVEVKPVKKPPHSASKKALKRIEIQEISDVVPRKITIIESDNQAFKSRVVEKLDPVAQTLTQHPKENKSVFKRNKEKAKVLENKQPAITNSVSESKDSGNSSSVASEIDNNKDLAVNLAKPKTFVQFNNSWKQAKTLPLRYAILKSLEPSSLPELFKESLDSAIFSEILGVLAEGFVAQEDKVFEYLANLTEVRRFSALTMFMGTQDKQCLMKLFGHIREHEDRTSEEVEALSKKYEM